MRKRNKARDITLPNVKLYHNALITKTVRYQHKNRHINQWNRIKNPELDPEMYGQLLFDKAGKSIQWKKYSLFSKWSWENWTETGRRMKLDHFLTPYTKTKWIKDLNVRWETIKTLEEKTDNNLFDLSCSNFLLDTSPKARKLKAHQDIGTSSR